MSLAPRNSRFVKALLRQPVDRAPIWLMRQAGRYLPEYRALRAQAKNFFSFCETPELACEATLQPLRRFPLDAAIIFSDILTVPRAMGCEIQLIEQRGPIAPTPIRHEQAIEGLEVNVLDRLQFLAQAIRLTKIALDEGLPLIGFAGSPWTVATYMVEGGSSKSFEIIKAMCYKNPRAVHHLLTKITDVTIAYLNMQVQAGVDVLMLFDSWGGVLSQAAYSIFSLDYMRNIAQHIKALYPAIPIIFFSKGCGLYLEDMISSHCDALGLDWTMDLARAKAMVAGRIALQGNLDPAILLSTPTVIRAAAQALLTVYQGETGFVFNLGHGISTETPIDNVAALVETVCNC